MNPKADLTQLLEKALIKGIIHKIDNRHIYIATNVGLLTVPKVAGYQVGDNVIYKDGQLNVLLVDSKRIGKTVWV